METLNKLPRFNHNNNLAIGRHAKILRDSRTTTMKSAEKNLKEALKELKQYTHHRFDLILNPKFLDCTDKVRYWAEVCKLIKIYEGHWPMKR